MRCARQALVRPCRSRSFCPLSSSASRAACPATRCSKTLDLALAVGQAGFRVGPAGSAAGGDAAQPSVGVRHLDGAALGGSAGLGQFGFGPLEGGASGVDFLPVVGRLLVEGPPVIADFLVEAVVDPVGVVGRGERLGPGPVHGGSDLLGRGAVVADEPAAMVGVRGGGGVPGVGGLDGAGLADVAPVVVECWCCQQVDLRPGAALHAVDGPAPGVRQAGGGRRRIAPARTRRGQ